MDDLDRLAEAFFKDPDFFRRLVLDENRLCDALAILCIESGVVPNETTI